MHKTSFKKNLLTTINKQFCFRTNHTTAQALISLTETIKTFLDEKKKVAEIFIDLKTAS